MNRVEIRIVFDTVTGDLQVVAPMGDMRAKVLALWILEAAKITVVQHEENRVTPATQLPSASSKGH
jgi:hypothetical protein